MGRPAFLTLFLVLSAVGWGQARTDLSLGTEAGWFNRAYQDRQYVSPTALTFAVPYAALGAELRSRAVSGSVAGVTLAQTTIGSGAVFNRDQWESQPLTVLTFGGAFAGWDGGWWEVDAGVGALVHLEDYGASGYRAPDGTVTAGRAAGVDWNRRESFTLVTALVRVLPEEGPHVVVRLGRGTLSLTENLFHIQGVLPGPTGRFDAEVSFSSPQGYWDLGSGILRNNERLTLGWAFDSPWGRWGLRAGLLLRPVVAGTGEVDLAHRLSVGLGWSAGWTD